MEYLNLKWGKLEAGGATKVENKTGPFFPERTEEVVN
jgi:hypothetical protein